LINGVTWTEFDCRENNKELNGRNNARVFAIPGHHGAVRIIRLRQTGLNHSGSNVLALSSCAIFGPLPRAM
jgi:hypothetical protein